MNTWTIGSLAGSLLVCLIACVWVYAEMPRGMGWHRAYRIVLVTMLSIAWLILGMKIGELAL